MHTSDNLFLLAGLILVLLGVVTFIYSRMTKNEFLALVVTKISKIFFTIGLLEVFWYFLRYQYVQALGTRFVAALILLAGLVWMYWPVKYFITRYKVDMAEAERKASREKYLNLK
jgi:cbb3-type cytochrome oxidase subunit 3